VREENEADADEKIASLLRGRRVLVAEVHGRWFHLFFESSQEAAEAALAFYAGAAPHLEHSLGLHSLPVRQRIHPVSGAITFSPRLIEKAVELAGLEPGGHIYTSIGFSALAEKTGRSEFRCEFLGHRPLSASGNSEPVFRLIASARD
jgi:hypothetical protein